jgi:alanine-synthesizing transaminase
METFYRSNFGSLKGRCYDVRVFSSRLHWNLEPNPLSVLLAEKRRGGARVLDLTESNPTLAGLQYPEEEILAAMSDPAGLRYHPSPLGMPAAREAVSNYYAERDTNIPASRILITASTSEAYGYLFKLLTDAGDEILTPRPSYPLFEFLAELESVRVGQYPMRYDGAWHLDFQAIQAAVTSRTRAIVVVNPNNPTGSFLKEHEHRMLQELAVSRGIAILSDEVFSDYGFASNPTRVTTLAGERDALTFSMSGLSKVAGLPQMKLGWIVVSGPEREAALDRLELIADTYLSVATPVQIALPRLLVASKNVRTRIAERTRDNLRLLQKSCEGTGCCALNAEGGWYAVIQVPRTRSEEEWALDLLRDRDVLVQPGFFFDFETEAYLVVSLLTDPGVFREGIKRLLELAC